MPEKKKKLNNRIIELKPNQCAIVFSPDYFKTYYTSSILNKENDKIVLDEKEIFPDNEKIVFVLENILKNDNFVISLYERFFELYSGVVTDLDDKMSIEDFLKNDNITLEDIDKIMENVFKDNL